jgi:actin
MKDDVILKMSEDLESSPWDRDSDPSTLDEEILTLTHPKPLQRDLWHDDLLFSGWGFGLIYGDSDSSTLEGGLEQSSWNELQTIVLDNGSAMCKAGFSGDTAPRSIFPPIVGRPKYVQVVAGGVNRDFYIGDEACAKAGILNLKYPIEHGIVTNWDDMEKIWHYAFYDGLRIDPADHPVLLSEPVLSAAVQREKAIEIMFESFHFPYYYAVKQPELALYGSRLSTGVVLDIGDGLTQILAIDNNECISSATVRQNLGGRDLTIWQQRLLTENGNYFTSSAELEIVSKIKEKLGYVAIDFDAEMARAANILNIYATYTLPDENVVQVASERFRCPELLFKPYLNGFNMDGIHQALFDCIMKCDPEIRRDMFAHIVLSGGSTYFPGFEERIKREIVRLADACTKVNVIALPERKYTVWRGGSRLAGWPNFPQLVITDEEYKDAGPGIVHSKCE